MTDERDPRNLGGVSSENHRAAMPGSRQVQGRVPPVAPGRGGAPQGRVPQANAQAGQRPPANVPGQRPPVQGARGAAPADAAQARGGAQPPVRGGAQPPVRGGAQPPVRGGAQPPARGGAQPPVRGGRPGVVAGRGGRPAAPHGSDSVPVVESEEVPVAEENLEVLDDIFGGDSENAIHLDLNEAETASPVHEEAAAEIQEEKHEAESEAHEEPASEPVVSEEHAEEEKSQEPEKAASEEAHEEAAESAADEAQKPEESVKSEEAAESSEHEHVSESHEVVEEIHEEVKEQAEVAHESEEHSVVSEDHSVAAEAHEEPVVAEKSEASEDVVAVEAAKVESEPVAEEEEEIEEAGPAEKGPAFQILPIPPELRSETFLRDNSAYRRESRSLLRSQNWPELVQMMQNVLTYAPWADLQEVRSSILKEMAGIYNDKLNDPEKTRATFEQLLREDPSNESALEYMEHDLREKHDFRAIHDMYRRVVDASWESDERMTYTQKAVDIAVIELKKPSLAVADWEHLYNMGEHGEEVQNALMAAYREYASWDKLANFIKEKCVDWGQLEQLGLREVIEIYISGLGDAERASETLNSLLSSRPTDPLLLLQEINICRLNNNIDKLAELSRVQGLERNVELDIHRAAADVLWDKGERELAVQAYDSILEVLPDDRDALNAKEQHFIQSDLNEQLCTFYENRAARMLEHHKSADAIELFRKAATVAEKKLFDNAHAITDLKKIVELDANDPDTHRKIIELYEALGDDAGVAASMEALLALTSRPAVRRELLSKLGGFYLDKLENFERAEDCWKKVQAIDPHNPSVSEELSRVYAKQGDFESLDKSLTRQIRMADAENIHQLALSKGKYLMQHSPESAHTAAGWEIVLDCDPDDRLALDNLASVLEKLNRNSERIGAMEQALRTVQDKDERISLGLKIAEACIDSGTHAQAVSAYLRVLNWDPTQETAIQQLESICTEAERGIVVAVLEVAATHVEDKAKRCDWLKQSLKFIHKDAVVHRIQVMRRIIDMGDTSVENDFIELCRSEKHSDILCAAWLRRAANATEVADRDRLLNDVARFSAEDLSNPSLAFTILFSSALDADKAVELAKVLEKLAPETNRWEEVVAVLGCLSSAHFDEAQRRDAIEKRIGILLDKLNSPARAMEEYARLLVMDPKNADLLAKVEELAEEHQLYEPLIGIYSEVWDNTDDTDYRLDISSRKYRVFKKSLSKDDAALHELFISYRLHQSDAVETKLIEESAEASNAALCVPLLESEKRAAETPSFDDYKVVANIYEHNLNSIDGAFALYGSILTKVPGDEDAINKLVEWSENDDRSGRYAQMLRLAAARAHKNHEDDTSVALYRRLATFYKNTLKDVERSIDVERAILHIQPKCIESLEALIAWHESREEWADLRSELTHRISAGGSDEEKIALWLRVVAISNDHLGDFEGAFDGYAEILQIDENNEPARAGIAALTGADIGPEVELRRLRLELKLSEEERRPEIMLKIAELQDKELSQTDASCETLEQLYQLTGPDGLGYEPLRKMYDRLKNWERLIQIMQEHADAKLEADEEDDAVDTLNEALVIADKKLKDAKTSAIIVEKLQKLDPTNSEIVERYCSALRNVEDWPKYAETIKSLAGDPNSKNVNRSLLFELARIQALALDRIPDAINTYQSVNKRGNTEKNAFFGIATLALKTNDIDGYLNALDQVLKLVDPVWGAIFYCHMAEVCDEKGKNVQVANYYRNARTLDPNNSEASDSLRSIGRRLKNWRSTSALLPLENEREMSWAERSMKHVEMSRKAENVDAARIWAWKAIAVNHDNVEAWQRLAEIEADAGRLEERYEAKLGAYSAVERTTLPGPAEARENARLIYETAQAAQACGNDAKAETFIRKAYAVAPGYAPVAIAIGDLEQDAGNIEKAYLIYDAILKDEQASLDDKLKSELYFKRGLISNIQKNHAIALDDLRTTVKMSPLHYDALIAIAKTYTELDQPLLALSSLQKSLLVTPEHTKRRGNILYDMGKLWGDAFNDGPEAGLYYEDALKNGASNVDLVERCLEIYKKAGRYSEALELVDTLTKTTTNPAILASLYCTRGELSESISTEAATEAYDMALSYQPGMGRAFDGLERMLVARQEWAQLADLLDGRLEGELTPDQQAAILVRLADLYGNQLNEQAKAADILYRLLESAPSADVIQRLLAMPVDDPQKRKTLLEKAIVFCPGCFDAALELAQNHLKAGRELQAWAIMSPLRALLQLDPQLKDTLNDLKNKFEKVDSVSLDSLSKALPILSDEQFALLDAIRIVNEKIGTLGAKKLDEITSGATEVTEFTPNGKLFHQMRAGLGLENITLWRSSELPEAVVVIDTNPVIVCLKTEIFQKAAGNELQFWLAKGITMAHPDIRIIASTPESMRHQLPMAVLAAVGIAPESAETAELVEKIKSAMSADELKNLSAQMLAGNPAEKLIECAKTFARDMVDSTDVIGAYIVADMRTVWRAESRVDSNIIEQRNVKTVDEINKAMDSSAILRKVLAYYVSSTFTDHLAS